MPRGLDAALDLGDFERRRRGRDLEQRIAGLNRIADLDHRPADDPRDLRLHLELLPRLDLADGDRLLDDRALRDLDLLEAAVFLLPVANDGIHADCAEREDDQKEEDFSESGHGVALLQNPSTLLFTKGCAEG
jgi:hypothetical protein